MLAKIFLLPFIYFSASLIVHATSDSLNKETLAKNEALKNALIPDLSLWEDLLHPVPTMVSVIGKLVVLSSQKDVSLASEEPDGGWEYLRHPKSLRASLLQLGNGAWNVFSDAHTKMDKIQLSMIQVPKHVRTATRLMRRMPYESIARFLRSPLAAIERTAGQSVNLSLSTQRHFLGVVALAAELNEAIADKQQDVAAKLVATRAKRHAAAASRNLWADERRKSEDLYNTQLQLLNNARSEYEKAIAELPVGFKALGIDIADSVADFFTFQWVEPVLDIAELVAPVFNPALMGKTMIFSMIRNVYKRVPQVEKTLSLVSSSSSILEDRLGQAPQFAALKTLFTGALNIVNKIDASPEKLAAQRGLADLHKVSDFFTKKLQSADSLSKLLPKQFDLAGQIIARGRGTLEKLMSSFSGKLDLGGASTLWNSVVDRLMNLDDKSDPHQQERIRNQLFQMHSQMERLSKQEDRIDDVLEQLDRSTAQLISIESAMRQVSIEETVLDRISELLPKVVEYLNQMGNIWNVYATYFQRFTARTALTNEGFLAQFANLTNVANMINQTEQDELRRMMTDRFLHQSLELNTISYFLHTLAKTYTTVSERYVLSQLAGLAQLLSAGDANQRKILMDRLTSENTKARTDISNLVKEAQVGYRSKIAAKRQGIEDDLKAFASGEKTIDEIDIIDTDDDQTIGTTVAPDDSLEAWFKNPFPELQFIEDL